MRILAVDPGTKRLGIALSDPTGTLAAPLTVLKHVSRKQNAARIAALAAEHGCERIVIGSAVHWDGSPSESSRQAANLARELEEQSGLEVVLWDESGTTQRAREIAVELGVRRKNRRGHRDAHAAALLLQSYLDSQTGGDR